MPEGRDGGGDDGEEVGRKRGKGRRESGKERRRGWVEGEGGMGEGRR